MFETGPDPFDEMDRIMRSFMGEVDSLFDPNSKCLKPLHRERATDEEVIVTLDLPCVASRDDIKLTSTDETIFVEARMRKPMLLKVGGSFQKRFEFERFSKRIKLSRKVDPNRATAKFRNGILTIRLPVKEDGRRPLKVG
jgi:HSP20 family molecular chaperone IbpA